MPAMPMFCCILVVCLEHGKNEPQRHREHRERQNHENTRKTETVARKLTVQGLPMRESPGIAVFRVSAVRLPWPADCRPRDRNATTGKRLAVDENHRSPVNFLATVSAFFEFSSFSCCRDSSLSFSV